jgi:hypothetical protein
LSINSVRTRMIAARSTSRAGSVVHWRGSDQSDGHLEHSACAPESVVPRVCGPACQEHHSRRSGTSGHPAGWARAFILDAARMLHAAVCQQTRVPGCGGRFGCELKRSHRVLPVATHTQPNPTPLLFRVRYRGGPDLERMAALGAARPETGEAEPGETHRRIAPCGRMPTPPACTQGSASACDSYGTSQPASLAPLTFQVNGT